MGKEPDWDPILKVYPKVGYFKDYYDMCKAGEICPRFHFYTSAAILGSVINRRVWFQRGSKTTFPPIFPNLWIVLMAPQGSGHKSSALRIGRNLLNALPSYLKPKVLAAKLTPEALVKTLATAKIPPEMLEKMPPGAQAKMMTDDAIAIIYSSELGTTLGREKYNQGFITLLTDLYDCHDEWSSETVMRGDQSLRNICLTMMAASTPDWMQSMLPADAFRGGFMSRLQLIVMPSNWNKLVADPPPPTDDQVRKVMDHLEQFATLEGQMIWDPIAKEWFEDWYVNVYKKRRISSGPMAAYLERKQDYLLRFAMLLQINNTPGDFILHKDSIQQALQIMGVVEVETEDVINFIATEPAMRAAQLVLEYLRRYKQLPEWKLYHLVWRSLKHPKEFEGILQMLHASKDIEAIDMKDEKQNSICGWKHVGRVLKFEDLTY